MASGRSSAAAAAAAVAAATALLPELTENDSIETIERALESLIRRNELLSKENEIFTGYIRSAAPGLLNKDEDEDVGRQVRMKKKNRNRGGDKSQQMLRPDQKCDIAVRYLDHVREEAMQANLNGEKLLSNLRAVLEEAETRVAEVKKDSYEFRRDIVAGAENPRTGKIIAEKVLRYLEDWMYLKDALMEKLRLKNSTLKSNIAKLESQLQQKEEMGEVLHAIDFDQLKIENQQYLEKIEDRNKELLKLKLTAGKTVQVLNSYKKRLGSLTSDLTWLHAEIAARRDTLGRIGEETKRVDEEKDQAMRLNSRLRTQQEEYRVPHVLEYVNQKAETYDLNKKLLDWQRKVEIAEMSLKRHRRLASGHVA